MWACVDLIPPAGSTSKGVPGPTDLASKVPGVLGNSEANWVE